MTDREEIEKDENNALWFQGIIEARIKHFNNHYHTYEGTQLQDALNTIIRLVPPIEFDIHPSLLSLKDKEVKEEGILKARIEENESLLKMAELHMDERAQMVLKARIAELQKQCNHNNAYPTFTNMKAKTEMYCPDCKQTF